MALESYKHSWKSKDGEIITENNYKTLETSVKRSYASVVWSHKIQEKQCDIYTRQYKLLETLNIIAASATSVGILSLIFTNQFWIKIISAILSFVTIFVSAYFKSFDLHQMTLSNKDTANKLLCIRDQLYLIILKIHMGCDSVNNLLTQYEDVLKELDKIYQSAPNTTNKAVKLARKALNVDKDNSFSEDEINAFLPDELRMEEKHE
ncbi:SLATT domain-containing protein [Ruminococcus sp. AM54-1NS]|nr:SLATT domain-containing protein [Ruminococcus sp. AM54-1NS]RGH36381.1 SLATT domain-containing protein [Ruminococcus sp. AM43-6]RGH74194.1 SLATT domain-containing protein [Ruminococcus sp. AM31-15AC]